jgi:hypothetical protein
MLNTILEKLGLRKRQNTTCTKPVVQSSSSFSREWVNKNEDEQTVDCNIYENGKFSHTVKVGYFTNEQIDVIRKLQEKMRKKN